VPIVLKFGRLKLLEPSGPVQACNEIVFIRLTKSICSETMCKIVHNTVKPA